jgi:hypothetical protein
MPVPSSGQLRLRADIALEVDGSATGDNVSLGTLADTAGFTTPPDTMAEFYGYTSCTAPSITTNSLDNVSYTSMRANGNVTADNGCTVTERGFYFGTSTNRTSNTKYTSGSGTGSYNRTFSGLTSSGTTYYAWAYAINSAGETSGSRVQASTLTPATYTVQYTYTGRHQWESPQEQSWAHAQMSANANWSSYAKAQYHHSSYGWSSYASHTNSWYQSTRPTSGYNPTMNDVRYKRTDTGELTEHRTQHQASLTAGSVPGYWSFSVVEGGQYQIPSGCTSGASVSNSYNSLSTSGCNVGCGTSSQFNCNCGGSTAWNSSSAIAAWAGGATSGTTTMTKENSRTC